MSQYNTFIYALFIIVLAGCKSEQSKLDIEVYETSASGNKLTKIEEFSSSDTGSLIELNPEETFQTITGFGGSFTESSAYLMN
ncbi:MAG: glycosyl hydrolase family 30, partial [Flavobacteriaceae bacterium]